MGRKLLVIDAACAFETIIDWKLQDYITCRDLGGFFDHVWTVHPFASLVATAKTSKFGAPEIHELTPTHTFIDGKVGRFAGLARIGALNFLVGQLQIARQLVALVRREGIDAVRTDGPLYTGLLALYVARKSGVPLVMRVGANYDKIHEATGQAMMPRLFRSYALEKRIMRFVFARTDLVAAVNQDNLEFAIANGARPDHTTIFRYGNLIDKRHVAPPESRDLSGRVLREFWAQPRRFLIHIGRLRSLKFPEDPLHALANVRRRGHDLALLMVGDGEERANLEALAKTLGIEEHVVFAGNRDQEWLSQVIPIAAAVVSPLTGRALSEAAFGGAPIVAYDLDWQGELIRSGESGELVPFRSLDGMANSIERFLTDTDYARRMGAGARRRAFEMLDPDALDRHEREAYTALLERHEARAM